MASSYFGKPALHDKNKRFTHRRLQIESLENRELLSVTLADLPNPTYEPPDSAYVAGSDSTDISMAMENDQVRVESTVTPKAAIIYLAKPASVKNAKVVTPTTITVNWGDPVATKTANTELITGFKIVVTNTKTKQVVETIDVGAGVRTATFEGLEVKTSYKITVTSVGDGASSDRATLSISTSTATFPLVTVRASGMTLTSATLTITDNDRATPFVDGKTVKNYTIEYIEKTKTIDWTKAEKLPVIAAGTEVDNLKKGTIVTEVTKLKPGTQYSFRVIATYTDGTTKTMQLTSEGRAANAKTVSLPTVTVSKSYFSVLTNSTDFDFAIGMDCKVANYAKLSSQIKSIEFSLLVSTSTTIDKTTGQMVGAKSISGSKYSNVDLKGVFSMEAISLESMVKELGVSAVLGTKTLGLQLVMTFTFTDESQATSNSKVGKITLPTWYTPA